MTTQFIRFVLVALLLAANVLPLVAKPLANFPYHEIESWHEQGMVFVVRDANGHIIAHAKGHLEKWVSESQSVWVVRDAQGRFMTYAHGTLETWADGTT